MQGELDANGILFDRFVVLSLVGDLGNRFLLRVANLVHSDTRDEEIRRMYPKGARILLRDPPVVRGMSILIENPARVQLLSYFSTKVVGLLNSMDAGQLRKQGNLEFLRGRFETAAELYSMSIRRISQQVEGDREGLVFCYSNRAECHLVLEMFREAGEDAAKALEINPNHVKSLFRLAKAMFHQQEYVHAWIYFRAAANLSPQAPDIASALEKAAMFVSQSLHGDYEGYLKCAIMREGQAPECSEYLGSVEIRLTTDGKGRGLFATQDIKAGELVMVCRPVAMVQRKPGVPDNLTDDMVPKLAGVCMKSKEKMHQLYKLVDSAGSCKMEVPPMHLFGPNKRVRRENLGQCEEEQLQREIEQAEVDIKRIQGIVDTVSYTRSNMDSRGNLTSAYTSLMVVPGFVNNSCIPNLTKVEVGGTSFFHANRDVAKGEELTVRHIYLFLPWSIYRRQRFQDLYDMNCRCRRCKIEEAYNDKLKHAANVVQVLRGRMEDEADVEARTSVAELVPEIEKAIQGASEEEKSCIRTSFIDCYVNYFKLRDDKDVFVAAASASVPSREDVIKSIRYCAPGDVSTPRYIVQLGGLLQASDVWTMIGKRCAEAHVVEEFLRQLSTGTGMFWFSAKV